MTSAITSGQCRDDPACLLGWYIWQVHHGPYVYRSAISCEMCSRDHWRCSHPPPLWGLIGAKKKLVSNGRFVIFDTPY
jgi:hypothetical protein